MATLEEVYSNVISDDEQRKAFVQAAGDEQALAALLEASGCEATPDEARAFLHEKSAKAGELADHELSSVSGGCNGGMDCPYCGSSYTSQGIGELGEYKYLCWDCGKIWR